MTFVVNKCTDITGHYGVPTKTVYNCMSCIAICLPLLAYRWCDSMTGQPSLKVFTSLVYSVATHKHLKPK